MGDSGEPTSEADDTAAAPSPHQEPEQARESTQAGHTGSSSEVRPTAGLSDPICDVQGALYEARVDESKKKMVLLVQVIIQAHADHVGSSIHEKRFKSLPEYDACKKALDSLHESCTKLWNHLAD